MTLDTSGIKVLAAKIASAGKEYELRLANKRILENVEPSVKERLRQNVPKSTSGRPSGKKGYRPSGHARDGIHQSKLTVTGTRAKIEIGWGKQEEGDDFFYLKFPEWGTVRQPPQEFILKTAQEEEARVLETAEREYLQLLRQIEGD